MRFWKIWHRSSSVGRELNVEPDPCTNLGQKILIFVDKFRVLRCASLLSYFVLIFWFRQDLDDGHPSVNFLFVHAVLFWKGGLYEMEKAEKTKETNEINTEPLFEQKKHTRVFKSDPPESPRQRLVLASSVVLFYFYSCCFKRFWLIMSSDWLICTSALQFHEAIFHSDQLRQSTEAAQRCYVIPSKLFRSILPTIWKRSVFHQISALCVLSHYSASWCLLLFNYLTFSFKFEVLFDYHC